MALTRLLSAQTAFGALGVGVVYIISLVIYRLFFHRTSHIPGPKLAAITYFYQFYYDVVPHKGQWMFHCEELHRRYGPIVRVGPDEIHIRDPKFYHEAFGTSSKRRDKSPLWYWFTDQPDFIGGTAFATLGHDEHARLRAAMSPFFSKAKVRELEGRIRRHVQGACERLELIRDSGALIDLSILTSALTLDVISEYSFGVSDGSLQKPNLGAPIRDLMASGVKIHPVARQLKPMIVAFLNLNKILAKFMPAAGVIGEFANMINTAVEEPYERAVRGEKKSTSSRWENTDSIVEALATDSTLSEADRSMARVRSEAANLIGAGTETTGRTLAVGLFYILNNPAIHNQLLKEIRTLMPSANSPLPSTDALAQLPYLTACIHESTRVAHGVAGRLVRIAPDQDLQYGSYTIPRGATFSMSNYMQHTDPVCFPEPFEFRPERYLGDEAKVRETLRYLVAFGKGPRMCLGMNLAWTEMYLFIAAVISRFDLTLVDTTVRDVTIESEYFIGILPTDSKGIRCRVSDRID